MHKSVLNCLVRDIQKDPYKFLNDGFFVLHVLFSILHTSTFQNPYSFIYLTSSMSPFLGGASLYCLLYSYPSPWMVTHLTAIKPWQNKKTCCKKHLRRTHVSPMFPSFAMRETLFPATKYVSAWRQKHILLLEHFFSSGKTGKGRGNMCPQQMFPTCF